MREYEALKGEQLVPVQTGPQHCGNLAQGLSGAFCDLLRESTGIGQSLNNIRDANCDRWPYDTFCIISLTHK